jgi:hypothetical protein
MTGFRKSLLILPANYRNSSNRVATFFSEMNKAAVHNPALVNTEGPGWDKWGKSYDLNSV